MTDNKTNPSPSEIRKAESYLDDASFPNNPFGPSGKTRQRELTETREDAIWAAANPSQETILPDKTDDGKEALTPNLEQSELVHSPEESDEEKRFRMGSEFIQSGLLRAQTIEEILSILDTSSGVFNTGELEAIRLSIEDAVRDYSKVDLITDRFGIRSAVIRVLNPARVQVTPPSPPPRLSGGEEMAQSNNQPPGSPEDNKKPSPQDPPSSLSAEKEGPRISKAPYELRSIRLKDGRTYRGSIVPERSNSVVTILSNLEGKDIALMTADILPDSIVEVEEETSENSSEVNQGSPAAISESPSQPEVFNERKSKFFETFNPDSALTIDIDGFGPVSLNPIQVIKENGIAMLQAIVDQETARKITNGGDVPVVNIRLDKISDSGLHMLDERVECVEEGFTGGGRVLHVFEATTPDSTTEIEVYGHRKRAQIIGILEGGIVMVIYPGAVISQWAESFGSADRIRYIPLMDLDEKTRKMILDRMG